MEEKLRKVVRDTICNAQWGGHFCQFYQTKEDLTDIVIPYFRGGLENNEFCMWITSEDFNKNEAEESMRKNVIDFDNYSKKGQMEIIPYSEWYLEDGVFNYKKVLSAWLSKLEKALDYGYEGMRVTGDLGWLEKKDWEEFANYEEVINNFIGNYRIIAICTYAIDKCGATETINVINDHQFAVIKHKGEWEILEGIIRSKEKEEEIKRSKEFINNVINILTESVLDIDVKNFTHA